MRRFVTIPVVMVAVVLGAAVPALRAAAQLVDLKVADQLVGATGQLVVGTDQLVVGTDQLVVGTNQLVGLSADQLAAVAAGTVAELTGMLVDSACYLNSGKDKVKDKDKYGDHTKCAIACAQKGARMALVTDKGDAYMIVGALTQDNNARLIPLINKLIVLSGMVAVRTPELPPTPVRSKTDTRRQPTTQDAVVTERTVRLGDFREGDVPDAAEATIEPTSVRLLQQ